MLGMILALEGLVGLGACIGAAVAAIGAGTESTGDIRSNMIVIAALVEGVALFAVIVCILSLFL